MKAIARGLGLLVLVVAAVYFGYGGGAGYFSGLISIPTPWNFVFSAAGAAALLVGLIIVFVRQYRRSRMQFGITLVTFVLGAAALSVYMATSPTTLRPSLQTMYPGNDPPYPVSEKFPLEVEAQGDDGTFVASVSNLTDETVSVWCFVEALQREDDAGPQGMSGMDFEVGPIPPGESKTVTKALDGNVEPEFSGGCKRTSY